MRLAAFAVAICEGCGEYRDECGCGIEAAWQEFLTQWQTTEMIRPAEAFTAFVAGYNSAKQKP